MPANLNLASVLVDHAVDLARFSKQVQADVVALLTGVEAELVKRLEAEGKDTVARQRLGQLRKDVARTLATGYAAAAKEYTQTLTAMAKAQATGVPAMFNKALHANVFSVTLHPQELEQLVTKGGITGGVASTWWDKQEVRTKRDFENRLAQGVVQAETNEQLVKRVFGKTTGREVPAVRGDRVIQVPEREGGIFQASRADARALVRTGVQQVSNGVLGATYEGNRDILRGTIWVATLDTRTTPICRSLDKCAWDLDGKPLPESKTQIPFPGRPPIHFNCRSVLAPLTKSWAQLAEEAAAKKGEAVPADKLKKLEGTFTPQARASMSGSVPGSFGYEEWLRGQPESRQIEALGPSRWRLWKQGKASFQDLVQGGSPLTLAQLQANLAKPRTVMPPAPAIRVPEGHAPAPKPVPQPKPAPKPLPDPVPQPVAPAKALEALTPPPAPPVPTTGTAPPEALDRMRALLDTQLESTKQAFDEFITETWGGPHWNPPKPEEVLAAIAPTDTLKEALTGAVPRLSFKEGALKIGLADHIRVIDGEWLDGSGVEIERTLSLGAHGLTLHNDLLRIPVDARGAGAGGLDFVTEQFERASKIGVKRIETFAAGNAGTAREAKDTGGATGFAGYAVWPKFGYNAPLTESLKEDLVTSALRYRTKANAKQFDAFVEILGSSKDIRELATTSKVHADLWAQFGSGVQLSFDSRPGSADMAFMRNYAAGARARRK